MQKCGSQLVRVVLKLLKTDHADKQPGLLGRTPDTGITDDTDRKAGGETGETDRETGAELDEAGVEGHGGGDCGGVRRGGANGERD